MRLASYLHAVDSQYSFINSRITTYGDMIEKSDKSELRSIRDLLRNERESLALITPQTINAEQLLRNLFDIIDSFIAKIEKEMNS